MQGLDFAVTVSPDTMAESLNDRVRERIKQEMSRRHLSQHDLADLIKQDQPRISRLLSGEQAMRLCDLETMCFAVGIAPTEAVRDHGLEFCAEMTPTELRLLEQFRRAPPEKRDAVLTLFEVRTKTATPDRHAGILPTKKLGQRGA